jgi:hypothetical protein
LTLWVLVFSAHHAAPNAPIWTGESSSGGHAHEHLAASKSPQSITAFTAVHEHIHSHCELCFSSAFNLPLRLRAALRPAENRLVTTRLEAAAQFDADVGLPDAHAPPHA